ncbi:MAG: hypothetical protein NTV46_07140 [Verrucomicrobia bacterium]|nr:hypothetical protein [Verrucomicrobiota bacterium]
MSRRSRKRGTSRGQGWLGKAALGMIVAGVLGAAILYTLVRGYLHSDSFRRFLSATVSEAAQVDGEFTPFRWDGLAVDTSTFEANGNGIVTGLRVDGLHTEVGVTGVRRGVWEIRGSRVQRMDISLDARDRGTTATLPPTKKIPPPQANAPGWLPRKVELQGLDVRELVVKAMLDSGPARVSGMRLRMDPDGMKPVYRVEVADGTIQLPFGLVPELRMNRARLRYQNGEVFLNNATAAAWKDGHVEASGEWDTAAGRYALRGDISGVKCNDLFNEDWSKRFIGDISSNFTLNNLAGSPVTSGRLTVLNGTLTALPVLDALAAYADTRRFRVLSLSEAHTDWKWQTGEVLLTNLVLASEGFVRLEGSISIRGRELDGTFRLGLAPGTLASIPGAETNVFAAGERGLLWAPLRITGTLDNPKEDLTDRLVAAAGQRMFDIIPETGVKVLKFTRSLFGDPSPKVIDKGVDIIKEGGKSVGGVLEGILGGGGQPQPK